MAKQLGIGVAAVDDGSLRCFSDGMATVKAAEPGADARVSEHEFIMKLRIQKKMPYWRRRAFCNLLNMVD